MLETKIEYRLDTFSNEKIKITDVDLRKDVNGKPILISSDVQTYGIRAVFAAVPHVNYEAIVDKKLQAKIDQSTKEAISKQELITAQQQALTEKAKGEQLIAKTRAIEESAKLEAVIRAEKEALVAAENLKRDQLKAKSDLAIKRANAEGDRLKVAAGLTPLEAATIEKDTRIGVAAALAGPNGITLPGLFVGGSNGSGKAVDPFTAVGLESLINITNKIGTDKK